LFKAYLFQTLLLDGFVLFDDMNQI